MQNMEPQYTANGHITLQPLRKTVWEFFKKMNTELTHNLSSINVGTHTKN